MSLSSVAPGLFVSGHSLRFKNLLVVIKQTAFEEYSQVIQYSKQRQKRFIESKRSVRISMPSINGEERKAVVSRTLEYRVQQPKVFTKLDIP